MPTDEAKWQELCFIGADVFMDLHDPHFIVDERHCIRHVNYAACESFGYDWHELVDQQIDILVPDAKVDKHRGYAADYMAAPKHRPMGVGLNIMAKRKSGVLVPVEVSLTPMKRSHIYEQRIIVRVLFKEPSLE